jgi:hypothetical protein
MIPVMSGRAIEAGQAAPGLCGASVAATRFWLSRAPVNLNWWWRQLGEVSSVARALLLSTLGIRKFRGRVLA